MSCVHHAVLSSKNTLSIIDIGPCNLSGKDERVILQARKR